MGQVEFLCQEHWINEGQVLGRKVQWFMGMCVCERMHDEASLSGVIHLAMGQFSQWPKQLD